MRTEYKLFIKPAKNTCYVKLIFNITLLRRFFINLW